MEASVARMMLVPAFSPLQEHRATCPVQGDEKPRLKRTAGDCTSLTCIDTAVRHADGFCIPLAARASLAFFDSSPYSVEVRRPGLVTLALSLIVGALVAAPAGAYTPLAPDAVVKKLNTFRKAQGIAGVVRHNPALSGGCRLHNAWMKRNRFYSHWEHKGSRGYTAAGAKAGESSVLANGPTWRTGNPWLNAPFHLVSMLHPGMVETGASETSGYNCLYVTTDRNRSTPQPAEHTFTGYPGPGGKVPYYQHVYEWPRPPQAFGPRPIRARYATGPNLVAIYTGPQMAGVYPRPVAATIRGPGGVVVPAKVVDILQAPSTLTPGTGIVIPRRPLQPGRRYTWSVTFRAGAQQAIPEVGVEYVPPFEWTSPTRTFITTSRKMCGAGVGGWYRERCTAPANPR